MRFFGLTNKDKDLIKSQTGLKDLSQAYNFPLSDFSDANFEALNENEVEAYMSKISQKNTTLSQKNSFLGGGCYYHHIPSASQYIISRGEFLTAYTPYQPEVSQGTLQSIFEYQTIICELTGMEVSNASLYDGQTSLTEAVLMSFRINKRPNVHILHGLNPDYQNVLNSYANITFDKSHIKHSKSTDSLLSEINENSSCVVVQVPDYYGNINSISQIRQACTKHGALLIIVVTEVLSLGILNLSCEADIVCGEAGSLASYPSLGGPSLGFLASKKEFVRQIPGRICGMTKDTDGNRGFVLTLNAREQHIRREKATSNICSNQTLLAISFTVHVALLGRDGIKNLAIKNHEHAVMLSEGLLPLGLKVENETFFNEFTLNLNSKITSDNFLQSLDKAGIFGGIKIDSERVLICATEMNTKADILHYIQSVKSILS